MNPFKALFQMPKAIDAAINSGDALVFTDEERKNWLIESAKVIGPQTIARRVIAIIVTCLFVFLTLLYVGLIIGEHSQVNAFAELYGKVFMIFGGIMAFYFGTSAIRAAK